MEQTAVEWLIEELERMENMFDKNSYEYQTVITQTLEEAKEMEKQQIKDAWIDCKREYTVRMDCYPPQYIVNESNQYYEKKFKNK